ncbi:hypothetical protein DPMN_052822 [Dreissena polymorpha]|uniref:Uncharacterized protein n=1 Tax=Dreissena polymorpha TaxID=45954 RepID=A0A9D4HRM5_DREPO|nr:hypothetical protein DPMN_052822 [Dreissena polymorpha]
MRGEQLTDIRGHVVI